MQYCEVFLGGGGEGGEAAGWRSGSLLVQRTRPLLIHQAGARSATRPVASQPAISPARPPLCTVWCGRVWFGINLFQLKVKCQTQTAF